MGEKRVTCKPGFKMNVDLGEWIGQEIYLTGLFEPTTAQLIEFLLTETDTMIDVGANIGFFTLLASRKVGRAGKVLAFEPIPSTCVALKRNLSLNSVANVVVYDIALSNTNGLATIYEGPARNKGLSSLRPIDNASNRFIIPTASLDSLNIAETPIHLIKIDVEGAEQLVIEGMTQCLQRDHPNLIIEVSEAFLQQFGHSGISLRQMLEEYGYRMYCIANRRLRPMPRDATEWPRQFNAFFTVDERHR